jgi:hypothetical protein
MKGERDLSRSPFSLCRTREDNSQAQEGEHADGAGPSCPHGLRNDNNGSESPPFRTLFSVAILVFVVSVLVRASRRRN